MDALQTVICLYDIASSISEESGIKKSYGKTLTCIDLALTMFKTTECPANRKSRWGLEIHESHAAGLALSRLKMMPSLIKLRLLFALKITSQLFQCCTISSDIDDIFFCAWNSPIWHLLWFRKICIHFCVRKWSVWTYAVSAKWLLNAFKGRITEHIAQLPVAS